MSTPTVFKRRAISSAEVAQAEAAAATAPITGDPRIPAAASPVVERAASSAMHSQPANYIVGHVYDVVLERIRSNPMNPRAVSTSQAVEQMAESLRTNGQEVAATGFIDGDGVMLIEGETRLRGARIAGLTTLRIEIKEKPANDRELYRRARTANVDRRDQTPLDDAVRWKELLAHKVYTSQAEISTDLKLPESTVSRTIALADMPQGVMFKLADSASLHTFQMLNAIREYWRGFGEEKTLEYIPEIVKNGWGYRRVSADAALAAKGPIRRPRGSKEAVTFGGAKGELKTFSGGRVELSFKGMAEEKIQDLVVKLKDLCSGQ
jgi:ParB family transcriptional regulator, chromosome partitioning protein